MYILVVFVSNISFKRVIENDMIWWCQTPNWGRYFTLLFEVILNCHLYTRKGDWKICWLITPLSKDWWCLFTPIYWNLLHIYNITHYSASYLIVNQDNFQCNYDTGFKWLFNYDTEFSIKFNLIHDSVVQFLNNDLQ